MRKRRLFGLLLIVAAFLVPLVLWLQGIPCFEYAAGPEVILGGGKIASLEWAESSREYLLRPNLPALLPTATLAAIGLVLLLAPNRRG
jgi:hypothetical protein